MAGEFVVKLHEIVQRGGVQVRNGLGSHNHAFHRSGGIGHEAADVLSKHLAIGEKERCVKASDHQSRDALALRMPADVVVAPDVLQAGQLGPVGIPRPPGERDQGQRDGDDDALQYAHESDAEERGHKEHRFHPAHPDQPEQGLDVHQRGDRHHDDAGKRGGGEEGSNARGYQHEHDHQGRGHDAAERGAGTGVERYGSPGRAAADGEAAQQAAGHVGNPQCSHFLVAAGVDATAACEAFG